MTFPTSTPGSNSSLLPQRPTRVSERKLDIMVSASPRIQIVKFLIFAVVFSFAGLAQNSNGSATTQAQVGQNVQLEGELHIHYQDFKDHARLSYTLKLPNGKTVPLQFIKNAPTRFLTGDKVVAAGQMAGGSLVLYSGSTNITKIKPNSGGGGTTMSSIPVPYSFGPQNVLVMLVNFQDDAVEPFNVTDAQNAYFSSANSFISENSYGQTSLNGDVVGWFTIPDSVTTCNITQIATDAQNAAIAAGVNLSNYTRYVYAFPYNSVCGWAGASNVGGNPSQSWINGSLDSHTVQHELGHAFGLWHSHSLDCGTADSICSSGTVVEYGDMIDVMGRVQGAAPDYNAFQKERLGWLNYNASPSIQTVTNSGNYTINVFEVGGQGPNALKILKSTDPTTGAKTWYYLEARQAVGSDAFLSASKYGTQNETSGVLFHLGTDGNGNSSEMLDLTPATPVSIGYFDPSLVVGQTFQDSTAGVSVTPTAVSSTGATVQITLNGSSCTAANPTISLTPLQSQGVTSGTTVSFTATVIDNDSSGCSTASFNLADAVPSGWSGIWSATSLPLTPGKSGSATLNVTSPAGTADGFYNISVKATNGSSSFDTASAGAAYVISTPLPLSISVSTSQSNYLPGQTVAMNVTVLSGISPAAGVGVTATVTSPKGRLTTVNGTTASNGIATLNYKLSKSAAAGTYNVGATATGTTSPTTAAAVSVASTSFTVQ